jgi:hypothetical protein
MVGHTSMNRFVPGFALLLATGLAACELVAGIETKVYVDTAVDATADDGLAAAALDASGNADGTGGDPLPDASAGSADANVADVVVADAEVTDVTSRNDAGRVDASPEFTAPDAGTTDPSAPCVQQPTNLFCDDFDIETAVVQKWEYQLITDDGGALSLFTGAYTSPGDSLLVVAPASTGTPQTMLGSIPSASLASQFRLAFDLRIDMDSLADTPTTAIAQLLAQRQGTDMELNLSLLPTGQAQLDALVGLDGGPGRTTLLPVLPLRTWVRLVIVYDVTAGVSVLENGQVIGADPGATGGAPGPTQFLMGMAYQLPPGTDTIRLEMDNVVFRGL